MISIQHLYYYLEIVRLRSISAAANSLGLSQPLLSRVVKSMEEELGVTLILRTTRQFVLTEVGIALKEYAAKILRDYDEMISCIDSTKGDYCGNVRLCCTGILLDSYFAHMLPRFYKDNPQISISVVQETSKRIPVSIIEGSSDIGIMMLPIKEQQYIEACPIIHDQVALMLTKNHPLARCQSVHIEQLKNEKLLLTGDASTVPSRFIAACEKHGFSPNVLYNCNMPEFIRMGVLSSNAVGVMARPLGEYYGGDDLVVVHLEPKIRWDIAVVRRKDGFISAAVQKTFDSICDYFNALTDPVTGRLKPLTRDRQENIFPLPYPNQL